MSEQQTQVRAAVVSDIPAILARVRDLARYEGDPDRITATEADYQAALFPSDSAAQVWCLVAVRGGEVAGIAIYYDTFSTWTGQHSTRMMDLYVAAEARGGGVGAGLVRAVAQECVERGRVRLLWLVATWNTSAIGFYERLGARREGTDGTHYTYSLGRDGLEMLLGA